MDSLGGNECVGKRRPPEIVEHCQKTNRYGNRVLIQSGGPGSMSEADIEQNNGAHQLHISACCGNVVQVKLLLETENVRVGIREWSGREAIHYAALRGHCDVITLLLKHKAKTTAEDKEKMQPLYYAASNGHTEAMDLLVEQRGNPDHFGKGRVHVLHGPASTGNFKAIAHLLDCRVDPSPRDARGVSPLDLASNRSCKDSCAILSDAMVVKNLRMKAAAEQKRGGRSKHEAALTLLADARKLLEKWPLPRLIGLVAWETSASEMFLKEFGQAIKSCNVALQTKEGDLENELVRARIDRARAGLRSLRDCWYARPEGIADSEKADFGEEKASDRSPCGEDASTEAPSTDSSPSVTKEEEEEEHDGSAESCEVAHSAHSTDGDWQSAVDAASEPEPESTPTCVVCLSAEATLVGKHCGHLAWCASCRRSAVHVALGGKGSKKSLSAAQLDRVSVACPVCRVQSCIVRYQGRAWRRAGNYEVFVPLD